MDWNSILEKLDRDEITPEWEDGFDVGHLDALDEDGTTSWSHGR